VEVIGGNQPKFVQARQSEEEAFAESLVHVDVLNPHSVAIGELVVEVRDGEVHVTPSSTHELRFVFHRGEPH
jgi:hypothetical protein